jgi:DNA-binding MarR family transcriptional regulator
MARIAIDTYLVESLLPDLVGHDRQPSAFIVYLYLWCRSGGRPGRSTTVSLQQIAGDTGLSKSAVQHALRTLKRRRLVAADRDRSTAVPDYRVLAPWRRKGGH